MRRDPHDHSAFTLIELLVVVAVISMLMAILLPALHRARAQAHSTRCQAYIRQLGTGMTMYLHEHGSYPAHKYDGVRWYDAMAKMLHGFDVQGCPTVADWEVGRNNAYGYNYKTMGSARFNDVSPTRPYENFPVKMIRAPSSTIAFGDTDGTGRAKPHVNGVKDPEMLGNHGYTLDPTFIPVFSETTINEDGEVERYAWHAHRTYVSIRHSGKSNFSFADGHVETLSARQVYRDNRYWNGRGGARDTRIDYVDYHYVDGQWLFPEVPAIRGS